MTKPYKKKKSEDSKESFAHANINWDIGQYVKPLTNPYK